MQIEINIRGEHDELKPVLALLSGAAGVVVTAPESLKEHAHVGDGAALPPTTGAAGAALPPAPGAADGAALPPAPGAADGAALPPVTTGAPPAVELDGEFFPWDERINTTAKTKLAKAPNAWKLIRGIDAKSPGLVDSVKAELRTKGYGVAPAAGTAATTTGDATPPVATNTPPTLNFPQIIAAINTKIQSGELNDAGVDAELAKLGIVGGPPMIGTKPELFGQVIQVLGLC